jgi:uncharacterized phiE125 gp8 family phage protein
MHTIVVTPPAPIVTWADADQHLKLDGDETDRTYVEGLIAAATGHIDGPGGWLNRALGAQTLEARFDDFRCSPLRLPYPEIISVLSVKHIDAAGTEQTIGVGGYELFGAELEPAFGLAWPTARSQRNAVRIRYQAGYAAGAPQLAVAKTAILLMVGDLYRNRGTTQNGAQSAVPMSTTVESLLGPLQVYR